MRVLAKNVIEAAKRNPGADIEVFGWVHRIRDMGGVTFVILRDRSGTVQLVLAEEARSPEAAEGKPGLTLESVIRASGKPALNEKAPGGAELRVESLELISRADTDLPYQVNGDIAKTGLDVTLDNRALSLRNLKIRSIFKIQAVIIEAFSAYLRDHDVTEIKTSKLVGGGTEGGAELFEVENF
jgi:nondiscriminating aspartyl-tRNA synthetase